jgi:serine/threonine protein kinase
MLKPFHQANLEFDIIREIGQDGQNSQTFVTHDHQLNAEIVAKRIQKAHLASPAEFFAESQALYASAHPNVVQIHYACFDSDHIFLAMPFYTQGSVKTLIDLRFLTVREIISLGAHILAGLHNIHSKNLIHFDLKPDNILLSNRGEALISDFGLAKQMNFSGVAAQDRIYGKMIPPEALTTDHFTIKFDIYQFGLTLYRMCNGNQHFNQQFARYGSWQNFDRAQFNFDLRNARFPDRSAFLSHIPTSLRNVIKKCLEVDPANRYKSAIETANALAAIDGKCLDWQYLPQNGKKVWTKNESGTTYELTVNADGSSVCYKTVNSGPPRKVGDACKALISERELQKLFKSY